MSGSLRSLGRRWFRSAVSKAVDFAIERLEEIDAELDEDDFDEETDFEVITAPDPDPHMVILPGRWSKHGFEEPVSSDDPVEPDPSWLEIPLVDEQGNEVISIAGEEIDKAESIDPDNVITLVPKFLPEGSLRIQGIRATTKSDGAVVGLIRQLSLGNTPNLFVHAGWAQLDAFTSLRALRAYPRFVADDGIAAEVGAWGKGQVVCTVSIYLDVIPPVDMDLGDEKSEEG
jgi:hypothetical protein